MGKLEVGVFVFLLIIGVASASGSWGDINDGNNTNLSSLNNSLNNSVFVNGSNIQNKTNNLFVNNSVTDNGIYNNVKKPLISDDKKYTKSFYIAIALWFVVFLLIIIFLYFFIRKPKNRWKR